MQSKPVAGSGARVPVKKPAAEAAAHPGYWAGLLTKAGPAGAEASLGDLTLENCRLSFFDRPSVEGFLLGIDHDARMIELRLAQTAELQRLSLEPVRELRFTQPVEVKPSVHKLREGGLKVEMLGRKAPFSVTFRDGKVQTGELYGYSASDLGLAVYLVGDGKEAVRALFPSGAIDSVAIGEPLGELLLGSAQLSRDGLHRALERQR